jgi:glycosyltransferase involved in cell wall biosynthesis
MSNAAPEITICICTYRRPVLLKQLLLDLSKQETDGLFTFSVVVADNDADESAKRALDEVARLCSMPVVYVAEPRRSISLARNKSLEPAQGDYIAFIDDDEFPCSGWLLSMYNTCLKYKVSGVFGPVRTRYNESTPTWVKRAGFFDRPEHEAGFAMPWTECRTGNVLIERKILAGLTPIFRTEFGGGASDIDLFRRLMEKGHRFVWCQEGIVHEVLPPGRCKRRFLLRRALLRGSISLRHPRGRVKKIASSLVAVPLYALALPFLQMAGHHLFMRYAVRLCDHVGRLLAAVGIHVVRVRDME